MVFIRLSGFKDRIGFISVLDFLGYLSCSNTAETSKTELRPFLTIFGTGMRAKGNMVGTSDSVPCHLFYIELSTG
jgi:hypothetical protein